MAKTIIVTGGAGFVGSNLCRKLLKDGNNIKCVDNLYTGSYENISDLVKSSNFEFINHDINEYIDIPCDQIYNLACPASPPHYQKDPIYTINTCFGGVKNTLDLANKYNATILQASTSEVYGDPDRSPQNENYRGNVNPIGIRSCYDEGKRIGETLCFDYFRKYKTKIRVIRIFNTYGPYMDPNDGRVVSNFITQAIKNQDITIYGDGNQTRSFQYIDDLVEGIIKMMNNKNNFVGPVNIGTQFEFSINQLAEIVIKMLPGTKSKIVYKELPSDDPKQRRADNTLAKDQLGREPKITLKEGLYKTIKYFENKLIQ